MVDEDRRRGKEVASILRVLRIYRRTNTPPHDFKGVANVSGKTRTRRFGEPKVNGERVSAGVP